MTLDRPTVSSVVSQANGPISGQSAGNAESTVMCRDPFLDSFPVNNTFAFIFLFVVFLAVIFKAAGFIDMHFFRIFLVSCILSFSGFQDFLGGRQARL